MNHRQNLAKMGLCGPGDYSTCKPNFAWGHIAQAGQFSSRSLDLVNIDHCRRLAPQPFACRRCIATVTALVGVTRVAIPRVRAPRLVALSIPLESSRCCLSFDGCRYCWHRRCCPCIDKAHRWPRPHSPSAAVPDHYNRAPPTWRPPLFTKLVFFFFSNLPLFCNFKRPSKIPCQHILATLRPRFSDKYTRWVHLIFLIDTHMLTSLHFSINPWGPYTKINEHDEIVSARVPFLDLSHHVEKKKRKTTLEIINSLDIKWHHTLYIHA